MVPCEEQNWKAILPQVEDTGADGVELNFGCPHGMSERGMGSAVGQVPEYIEMVTRWCKQHSRMPVIVKLTPNITDIRYPARAAKAGGADAVSPDQHDQLDHQRRSRHISPEPTIDGKGAHGGYCGPAVKPIALNMVAEIARDPETAACRSPASAASPPGAMRPSSWRSARHRAGLHRGDDLRLQDRRGDDLRPQHWMDEKGMPRRRISSAGGAERHRLAVSEPQLRHQGEDRPGSCIQCGRCYAACEDTSHQAITNMVDGTASSR
jgi:dihydropyrimidine dehydrogenase (NAD+) subunit PreA